MSVKRTAFGFLAFAAGLAILVIALKALNVLPLIAQKDLMPRYADFEEMRTSLGIREVLVPSYFPEDFRWPPTGILAQGKPYPAVIMEFERSGEGKDREVGMMICQTAEDDFTPDLLAGEGCADHHPCPLDPLRVDESGRKHAPVVVPPPPDASIFPETTPFPSPG